MMNPLIKIINVVKVRRDAKPLIATLIFQCFLIGKILMVFFLWCLSDECA